MEKSSQIHGSKPGDDTADEPDTAAGQSQITGQGAAALREELDG